MPAASRASSKPSCLSQSRYKPPSNEKMQLLNSSNNALPRYRGLSTIEKKEVHVR